MKKQTYILYFAGLLRQSRFVYPAEFLKICSRWFAGLRSKNGDSPEGGKPLQGGVVTAVRIISGNAVYFDGIRKMTVYAYRQSGMPAVQSSHEERSAILFRPGPDTRCPAAGQSIIVTGKAGLSPQAILNDRVAFMTQASLCHVTGLQGGGAHGEVVSGAAAAGILTAAALQDLLTGRIENRLILCGLCIGFLCLLWPGVDPPPVNRLAAGVLPVLLFWFLFRIRAFGAGDIKLMAVLGLLSGLQMLLVCIVIGLFAAAAAGICLLLVKRQLLSSVMYSFSCFREMLQNVVCGKPPAGKTAREKGRNISGSVPAGFHKMCFAPALLCGFLLAQVCGIEKLPELAVFMRGML